MRIEDASELIFMTYYMVEWDKVKQKLSDERCVECGNYLYITEKIEDVKGTVYRGSVCHKCKRVLWLKE
jgi:uncharacterized protein with PIN domain